MVSAIILGRITGTSESNDHISTEKEKAGNCKLTAIPTTATLPETRFSIFIFMVVSGASSMVPRSFAFRTPRSTFQSLAAQRHHRVHPRRAPGREVTRQQGDAQQHAEHGCERGRVERPNLIQQAGQ